MLKYSFQILILNFGNQFQLEHICRDLEIDVMGDGSHIWMMNAGYDDNPVIIGNIFVYVCMCVWERDRDLQSEG